MPLRHRHDQLGEDDEADQQELVQSEKRLMDELRQYLEMHRLPPVLLGSGRTTLPDKFCTLMHALAWEVDGPHALRQFCCEVVATTTDLGLEFGVGRVAPVAVNEVLPWICQRPLGDFPVDAFAYADDDWEAPLEAAWPDVSLKEIRCQLLDCCT